MRERERVAYFCQCFEIFAEHQRMYKNAMCTNQIQSKWFNEFASCIGEWWSKNSFTPKSDERDTKWNENVEKEEEGNVKNENYNKIQI